MMGGTGGVEAPPAPAVQKKKVFYILNIHSKERLWSRGLTVYLQRAATGGLRTAITGSGSGTGSGANPPLPATLKHAGPGSRSAAVLSVPLRFLFLLLLPGA